MAGRVHLSEKSTLTPAFLADIDSVRDAINEARDEALIRQHGREAAALVD